MAARSVATRPSPNEKSRPAAAHVVAFIGGAMVRDMPLSCNGPALRAPGAIPTVDFLLPPRGAAVKKMAVKSHDWIRRRIQRVARMERPRLRSPRELRPVPRERVRRSAQREGGSEIRGAAVPDYAALHPGYNLRLSPAARTARCATRCRCPSSCSCRAPRSRAAPRSFGRAAPGRRHNGSSRRFPP